MRSKYWDKKTKRATSCWPGRDHWLQEEVEEPLSRPRSSDPALGVSKPWEEVAILAVGILRGGQTNRKAPASRGAGSRIQRESGPTSEGSCVGEIP